MKTIKVVAAIIIKDNRIYATQRGYGDWKDYWEFPGGKIEPGETPQEALKREIKEELAADINVGELIDTVEYDYPVFHLSMDCFWCELKGGHLTLLEAEAAKWLSYDELYSVNWLPADYGLIETIKKQWPANVVSPALSLFLRQKELLDTFLSHHAISQAQYDKSLGDLIVKMRISPEEADSHHAPV